MDFYLEIYVFENGGERALPQSLFITRRLLNCRFKRLSMLFISYLSFIVVFSRSKKVLELQFEISLFM